MNYPDQNNNACGGQQLVAARTREIPEQISRQDAVIDDLHQELDKLCIQLSALCRPADGPNQGTELKAPAQPPRPANIAKRLSEHSGDIERACKRIATLREKLDI